MEQEFQALQKLLETVIEFFVKYSFSVLGAVIILILGFLIAGQVAKALTVFFSKKNLDITLSKFLVGIVRILIIGFALIVALSKFGITIAPLIAALGAMAFGASFAFQGPLGNYGAGLSIIISRPFAVGDTITVQEVSGVVLEVKLACTILVTEDSVRITIPNRKIVGEILQNSKENRIVDQPVGISYGGDPEKAIDVIRDVLSKFPQITQSPNAQIGILEFGDSSINIGMRYWVPTKQYYQTLYAVNAAVYKALKKEGISIPFPQRDLHIVSNNAKEKVNVG